MEYYPAIKKNEILPFATTWIDLEGIMLSEISQREKDKSRMIFFICGILKEAQRTTDLWLPQVGVRGWAKWVKGYKLTVLKQISPEDVMYSMITTVNNIPWYI